MLGALGCITPELLAQQGITVSTSLQGLTAGSTMLFQGKTTIQYDWHHSLDASQRQLRTRGC